MSDSEITSAPPAGVLRQLAAAFYDGLLLIAIVLLASALTVPLTKLGLISRGSPLISIYLFFIIFLSVAWFWTHTGQTLGMRVWHVRVQQANGQLISWKQAAARFLTALPAWILLCLALFLAYVPEDLQPAIFPDWLHNVPTKFLFLAGVIGLTLDHWQNSWRDRLTRTQTVVKPLSEN